MSTKICEKLVRAIGQINGVGAALKESAIRQGFAELKRTDDENHAFRTMLPNVNLLYLGGAVLALRMGRR